MTDDGPAHAGPSSARHSCHPGLFEETDMKKTLCAMKAALGIRGIAGGCHMWRWVFYHSI
jgi:hypothetical protein